MKRVFNKAKSKKEADEWDIIQNISMTPDERFYVVDELKKRVYGTNNPDVREAHKQ
jgi:hypothetical protein